MKTVGITGGIGSGKSTACEVFKILGIPVYQADERAKHLMQHDPDLKLDIVKTFGEESYKNGELNRPYLAQTIFSDIKKTTKMNALVHPAVGKDFQSWLKSQDAPYVLKEAALMIESGSYKKLDLLINVFAPVDIRIQRVQKRDPQRSLDEIKGIINKQADEKKRGELSDLIINNDGTELLIPQILTIHTHLVSAGR
ncbi:dephospho-CoA kinase [Reichenbachiella faecimaris]|uniref:Dephospho-CoA kinase n=1 Tax=Reichenbachiella faecimaris TaxID=692418 RepID=A0A1W2GH15_REIFA|nr:dephospho-CoA kinase [Reichenbachiella faecimaris]SMD35937.1 dephospho-CoA kinase [Reichenbachiella faecimaris]